MGLYPNTVIGFDDTRLCFTRLDSGTHYLLNVPIGKYTIKGNTIRFHSDCMIREKEITSLIANGFVYSLLVEPKIIPENNIHFYNIKDDDALNRVKCSLINLTFILDGIGSLPELHYPFLLNNKHRLSDSVLGIERIKAVLSKMRYVQRIRLLSKDILNSDILFLKDFNGIDLEIIVSHDYYLKNYESFLNIPRKYKLIVYINDTSSLDERKCLQSLEKSNVSFFYPISRREDLKRFANLSFPAIPFPSSFAQNEVVHEMLDYSVSDLLGSITKKKDLLLKTTINPLFYGSIIVDNDGNLVSYPFIESKCKEGELAGDGINQLKDNPFWHKTRSDYFEKCRDCAFIGLCPPLSNYEINLRQTFCKLR